MKSPVGGRKQMEPVTLEDGLTAYRCPESGGIYIPSTCYMRWISQQPARMPQLPVTGEENEVVQTNRPAAICPESGTIMTRYKVGHGFQFTIDRSITGGIWLDAGEWDALRQRNFHDELNLIFTQSWQRNILKEEQQQGRRQRMEAKFGTDLIKRIDAIKAELQAHANSEELLAYLMEQ
jgi:hypothetical protein